MTLREGRFRVGAYFVVEWLLRISTVAILLLAGAKGIFISLSECSMRPCSALTSGISTVVNSSPSLVWLWFNALPDPPADSAYLTFFSPMGLCALFFFALTFYFMSKRRKLRCALDDAEHNAQVAELSRHDRSTQTASYLQAGGDIYIDQRINDDPRLRDWDKNFFNSPFGQIVIAAAGGTLAIVVGKLLTG